MPPSPEEGNRYVPSPGTMAASARRYHPTKNSLADNMLHWFSHWVLLCTVLCCQPPSYYTDAHPCTVRTPPRVLLIGVGGHAWAQHFEEECVSELMTPRH